MHWNLTALTRACLNVALFSAAILVAHHVHAATIVEEQFIYSTGNLAASNGGAGWNGTWFSSGGGNGAVSSGSLAYSDGVDTLVTSGNRAHLTAGASAQGLIRHIDLSQPALTGLKSPSNNIGADGASIWFSFLGQFGGVDGEDNEGGNLTWMRDGNTAYYSAVSIGEGSGLPNGVWQVKLPHNIGVDSNVLDFDINTPGIQSRSLEEETYFVGRIDYGAALDTLHLWLDPDLTSVPLDAQANFVGSNANLEIDRIRLAAHRDTSDWDEIRMATTFAEVVTPAVDDPSIPDLIYNAATGEVVLDPDASTIIGYTLKNLTDSFLSGGHTPVLSGVATSLSSEISEAALSAGSGSIGLVMPPGMDITQLFDLLSVNQVSRSLGSPLVPFDLIVIGDSPAVPEPSTYAMGTLALVGLGFCAWRRRGCYPVPPKDPKARSCSGSIEVCEMSTRNDRPDKVSPMNLQSLTAFLVIFATVCFGWGRIANATIYQVTQLTDNDVNDDAPQISGNNVVWLGEGQNSQDVFLYDGLVTRQLTNNSIGEFQVQVDGDNVVWKDDNGDIFFYDGATATNLTTEYDRAAGPQLSGNNVVWVGSTDDPGSEIFFYDGTTITQLTHNGHNDRAPQISGNNVVWDGFDEFGGKEVYLYDGNTTIPLSLPDSIYDATAQVSGDYVVWDGKIGHDYDIYLYDGATTIDLTDNIFPDRSPQVSGTNVVWHGRGVDDYEIFLYDGVTITNISDNDFHDDVPQVSGDHVVWRSRDGSSDTELFLYDGATTIQLTDNAFDDEIPQISGANVVWRGWDGNDWEIYMATPVSPVPEPSTYAMGVLALVGLGFFAWRRRRGSIAAS